MERGIRFNTTERDRNTMSILGVRERRTGEKISLFMTDMKKISRVQILILHEKRIITALMLRGKDTQGTICFNIVRQDKEENSPYFRKW